ncbi:MAG: DUF4190 domain-containing protein [Bacteroidota bacterium]|nr:DUF4190 domain-containing protein [Bacteroidota bacterium]MDP3145931.1 DUF4190 domain-containing protein [Bacteroidota bacterium]
MKKILFIIPLLVLISCSVQKRKYQKGFYVSNPIHHLNSQNTTSNNSKKEIENSELTASIDKETISLLKIISPAIIQPNDSLCDIITLKNGDEVKVTILELTPALVKYKRCGDAESPLYIAKKADVFKIKYANGTFEVFNNEEVKKPIPNNNQNNSRNDYKGTLKTHPLAIWAFVYSIVGLIPFLGLFTSIRAIFYGARALKIIRDNPTEYKGDLLATAAIVIGIIGLVLLLLILFALLVA